MANIYQAVKAAVPAVDAARYLGIEVNRNGYARCPFHDDRHPSLKLDRRFHCFGCGADGDVIDFAAKLLEIGNYAAARKLADAFGVEYERSADWKGRAAVDSAPAEAGAAQGSTGDTQSPAAGGIQPRAAYISSHDFWELFHEVEHLAEQVTRALEEGNPDRETLLEDAGFTFAVQASGRTREMLDILLHSTGRSFCEKLMLDFSHELRRTRARLLEI